MGFAQFKIVLGTNTVYPLPKLCNNIEKKLNPKKFTSYIVTCFIQQENVPHLKVTVRFAVYNIPPYGSPFTKTPCTRLRCSIREQYTGMYSKLSQLLQGVTLCVREFPPSLVRQVGLACALKQTTSALKFTNNIWVTVYTWTDIKHDKLLGLV